jgi:hypothetical protein
MSIKSHADIIALWPSQTELARDCDAELSAVNKWKTRNRIPSDYWHDVTASAKKRGLESVTLELLAKLQTSQ